MGDPGVTVVVPTLNRGAYLLDTVRDLLAQEHRPLEILIVDQSDIVSTELETLVAAHPKVISHHRVTFRGLPIARNYGWQLARHELIVYVDDDIRCSPEFVLGYVQVLTSRSASVCGGGIDGEEVDPARHVGEYNRWISASRGGFASHDVLQVDHVRGCNFAARRDVLMETGGFDERLGMGAALHEETEFMLRARALGHQTLFLGTVRVTHLGARGGGTRQRGSGSYVYAFMHNRAMLIRRHSQWYQWPFGIARSARMTLGHVLESGDHQVFLSALCGTMDGWRSGGKPPRLTCFERKTITR